MQNILIVGAGTMGLDIAQVFAAAGKQVAVRDMNDDIIEMASAKLTRGLAKRVEKGRMTEEARDQLLDKIAFMTDFAAARDADLVIEAIVEDTSVKKEVFGRLDSLCRPACVFATNTSSISITELATATGRRDRFIGMHFFNPATAMQLIEIIRGARTSEETYAAVRALSEEIGKTPVEVSEAPGFVVNRLLVPMINEACFLLESGVASAGDIDQAMKLGANHPMGPLALADLIGLDVCLAIMDSLLGETGDSKYRACGLLRKMVRGDLLGRKTRKGFYAY